ncbi:hypothetical protein Poli38472_004449 [Pythium oligandrum]|uniref:Ankyrin repeat protein n=1 Tax=Pythium oligandrum TaxID=41045 RepID=A0A8K1CA91_PYTOL|nr:hypothetical protein Poli38472_004449 [Pythium oligandrum]|eukprot:TMW59380.1 hypothetical protein Poli38472_004449 [Pythium oligandrum]
MSLAPKINQQPFKEQLKHRQQQSLVSLRGLDEGNTSRDTTERAVESESHEYTQNCTQYHRSDEVLLSAVDAGRLDELEQYYQLCGDNVDVEVMERVLQVAVTHHHLPILEWAHKKKETSGWSSKLMDVAIENDHFEIVQFLHEKRNQGCTVRAFEEAIKRQQVKTVNYLYEHRPELIQWPQLEHASMLKDLLLSWHPYDKEILDCVLRFRRERY